MKTLKIVGIEDGEGIILPEEFIQQYGLSGGDNLEVVETTNGIRIQIPEPSESLD